LFGLADSTLTEKPFVRRMASVDLFHRAKCVVGRAKHLQSQYYVFAAGLYQTACKHWASVLVGALLYVKGRYILQLVGGLAQQLRLPALVRHVWVVDRRGIAFSSTPAFASLRSHSGNPESFREFGTIPPWKRWPPLAGDVTYPHESQGFRLSGPFVMRLAQGLLCSMAGKDKRKRMG
jgi:hypothetical protein